MKNITTHSKSGLFLMEMIFVLLFLGLTCGICVRLFAASYTARQKAREADHIQELVTNTGEILEGTDGTAESFLALMPDGNHTQDGSICYYYDKKWQISSRKNSIYKMDIALSRSDICKNAHIRISRLSGQGTEEIIYTQTIRFPLTQSTKEGVS